MTQLSLGIVREEEFDIAWNRRHTAIVFTIAPNGHVISHEIDDVAEGKGGGQKNDIELEIFAPGDSGYLLWRRGEKYRRISWDTSYLPLGYHRFGELSLTRSQKKKIFAIVSQGEKIQHMLGTIMVNDNPSSVEAYIHRSTLCSSHVSLRGDPVATRKDIQLIECSYEYPQNKWNSSTFRIWDIEYDTVNCSFLFSREYHPDDVVKSQDTKNGREYIQEGVFFRIRNDQKEEVIVPSAENPYIHTNIAHISQFSYRRHLANYPYPVVFYAAQAENKQFNFSAADAVVKRNLVAPHLRVMYGIENIFDFYEIDDAVLLLEEVRISDTVSELYWTLAIAHNTVIRNFKRIISNNPMIKY